MTVRARRVRANDWLPIDVEELEDHALTVVRSVDHRSVIAGPGAGKTELLAQRAAFLLQTGTSPAPRRILAISFKRDAARNLAQRVKRRCHAEDAARFDSLTFDAFAKGLVDRFGQTLPQAWRPRPDYEIAFATDRDYRDFLNALGDPPREIGTRAELEAIDARYFARDHLFAARLPVTEFTPSTVAEWAAERYWRASMFSGAKTWLSFPMIGRLAELLVRVNPLARDALRLTYSHLFMDEFQDTTQVQYDLVHTIFAGSGAIATAVGDHKQQIMRWAMAMDHPFEAFEADFGAQRTPLHNNYRSSPDLVRIQHVLAQALDQKASTPVSKVDCKISGDSCAIWTFGNTSAEAAALASFVASEMKSRGLAPRDFVLLVRQTPHKYVDSLDIAFRRQGIMLRNEAGMVGKVMLQDLLAEEVSVLAIAMLRLATAPRAGRTWSQCVEYISALRGLHHDDDRAQMKLELALDRFALQLAKEHTSVPESEEEVVALLEKIIDFLGRDALRAAHPPYAQGAWLETVLDSLLKHLTNCCANAGTWAEVLDAYDGVHAVPLMTIHKSKGLEYDTVIFVGLDDAAWWSFEQDKYEATAGFFVAFTRAKQQVIFSYCASRGERKTIAPLYDLLEKAGVPVQAH
ncbi:MAG: ATP-dependent helicase [Phycisphaerales bacterium]|nr:ATP-dependent helicase [Hyphomonadaceae bacterium]